tara:strand:+ start:443 stop:1519 length:1077 start_codon:yes stop_codon:yes gene_type:complete
VIRLFLQLLLFGVLTLLAFPSASYAECSSPVGVEGEIIYNIDYKTVQFCDGTTWWNMKGGGGDGLIALDECQSAEAIIFNVTSGMAECPYDHTPDAFSFVDQTGGELSTATETAIIQIANIDDATDIAVSGDGTPEYRICNDATCSTAPAYTSAAGTIDNGQYVQLRLTSNATYETLHSAALTIGESVNPWNVTTRPDCFIVGGANSCADCSVAGGTVVATGVTAGESVCKFSVDLSACPYVDNFQGVGWRKFPNDPPSTATNVSIDECSDAENLCPSGWSRHENWTTTTEFNRTTADSKCSVYNLSQCLTRFDCSTGEHSFANTARESCQAGIHIVTSCDRPRVVDCYARVTEVGCK